MKMLYEGAEKAKTGDTILCPNCGAYLNKNTNVRKFCGLKCKDDYHNIMRAKTDEVLEFDYDKIMQENVVVHCETLEQSRNLKRWAHSKGLKWFDGDSYLEVLWNSTYTILNIFDGYQGSVKDYPDNTILKYEEVLIKEQKSNLGEMWPSKFTTEQLDQMMKKSPNLYNPYQEVYLDTSLKGSECYIGSTYDASTGAITIETNYNEEIQTEKEMGNYKTEVTLESTTIIIDAKGLVKDDIDFRTDKEENTLHIETKKELSASKLIKTHIDLGFKETIVVDKKYDVTKLSAKLENGILLVTIPVQEDRIGSVTIG